MTQAPHPKPALSQDAERLLISLKRVFEMPSEFSYVLLARAISRLIARVKWLSVIKPDLNAAARELESKMEHMFDSRALPVTRKLTGKYRDARALVGKEVTRAAGPESMRAALLICALTWAEQEQVPTSAISAYCAHIRDITESLQKHRPPNVLEYLRRLGEAHTLDEFIDTAHAVKIVGSTELQQAWARHFEPTLLACTEGLQQKVAGHSQGGTKQSESRPRDDFTGALKPVWLPVAPGMRVPGEPDEESAPVVMIAPLLQGDNPDKRRLNRYFAGQAIWSSNHLLCSQHYEVLTLDRIRRVISKIRELLEAREITADLELGLVGLLLQALSGRTVGQLIHIQWSGGKQIGAAPFSLTAGFKSFQLRVFYRTPAGMEDEASGFFQPSSEQLPFLEAAEDLFELPLTDHISRLLDLHKENVYRLTGMKQKELDGALRRAARHVSAELGWQVFAGQVRRSFSVHLYEQCRDTAICQLIAGGNLGQSQAPLHYYAPKKNDLAEQYGQLIARLFETESLVSGRCANTDSRVGALSLPRLGWARQAASLSGAVLNSSASRTSDESGAIGVHQAMVVHVACMFLGVTGHRPTNALFQLTLDDLLLEKQGGAALFRDKSHDVAHDPRLAVLPEIVVEQVRSYLRHLTSLAALLPLISKHIERVLGGSAPLLFEVGAAGPAAMTLKKLKLGLPGHWTHLNLNWGRTWIRTRAVENGLPAELAAIQLGHYESVGYPFSNASPTRPRELIDRIGPALNQMARSLGWRVRSGLASKKHPFHGISLPPLQSWTRSIDNYVQRARQEAERWRAWKVAGIATLRQKAEQDVLSHPTIVERRIDKVFAAEPGPWSITPLSHEDAVALRDNLFEDAGSDVSSGIALTRALNRILSRVYKRLKLDIPVPPPLGVYRRHLDNAFIPGMMSAVRQVEELRLHARHQAGKRLARRETFSQSCARVAYTLAVFGYVDRPDQIIGLLRHRTTARRLSSLNDVVLVNWGDSPDQVMGLRHAAAVSLADLARRWHDDSEPPRHSLTDALDELLPQWARSENGEDALELLCATIAVANRFELSPAARLALDPSSGSTNASINDQIALFDRHSVESIVSSRDLTEQESKISAAPSVRAKTNSTPRSQYLQLVRVLPESGFDLHLPITGVNVPASQIESTSIHEKIIAELDVMLCGSNSTLALHPIVRLLAYWVRQMRSEGTSEKRNPANSTIKTYLTRIGASLVELVAGRALIEIDEGELEEIYLAAVESHSSNRKQAAAAIMSFHSCSQIHCEMPDVDLSVVASHLRDIHRPSDANLIVPQQRDAIISLAVYRAEAGKTKSPQKGRLDRQVAAALAVLAWSGARKSEILGVGADDVWSSGEELTFRVQQNRSRRLKTPAARRLLNLNSHVNHGVDYSIKWIKADRQRSPPHRQRKGYIFSPLEQPSSASGREPVAVACANLMREITGRSSERIHRFRHLSAFERLMPLFLNQADQDCLQAVVNGLESNAPTALPREALEQIIPLGHVQCKTTLVSYIHTPWLIRSFEDAHIKKRHWTRREAAFAMGVSLSFIDQLTHSAESAQPWTGWFDHVIRMEPVEVDKRIYQDCDDQSSRIWTVEEIEQLLRIDSRSSSLKHAAWIHGLASSEINAFERQLLIIERRLGRRLATRKNSDASIKRPKTIIRSSDSGFVSALSVELSNSNRGGLRAHLESLVDTISFNSDSIEADQGSLIFLGGIIETINPDVNWKVSSIGSGFGVATATVKSKSFNISDVVRAVAIACLQVRLNSGQS